MRTLFLASLAFVAGCATNRTDSLDWPAWSSSQGDTQLRAPARFGHHAAMTAAEKEQKKAQALQEFQGVSFGVALAMAADLGGRDRVQSAEVVDGIVRVSHEDNVTARVMLETHYFFTPAKSFLGMVNANRWGVGPFVSIQPGSDQIIDSIGFGAMLGFRYDELATTSFNIGLGFVVDPNVQVLGDGIEPNEPLPGNEDTIRYQTTDQWGLLLLVSFAWSF